MITAAQILKLKENQVVSVPRNATVRDAVDLMTAAQIGCVIVEEGDGSVAGILSERDVLQRVISGGKDPESITVSEVMTSPVAGCAPDDDLQTCAEALDSLEARHLPVLEGDKVVGMISVRDVLTMAFES